MTEFVALCIGLGIGFALAWRGKPSRVRYPNAWAFALSMAAHAKGDLHDATLLFRREHLYGPLLTTGRAWRMLPEACEWHLRQRRIAKANRELGLDD